MKLIYNLQLLSETQLSVNELMKPNMSTGEPRADILLKLIKGNKD